jgi:hypothetical protein
MNFQQFLAELKNLITGGKQLQQVNADLDAARAENAALAARAEAAEGERDALKSENEKLKGEKAQAETERAAARAAKEKAEKEKAEAERTLPVRASQGAAKIVADVTGDPLAVGAGEVMGPTGALSGGSLEAAWNEAKKDPVRKAEFMRERRDDIRAFLNESGRN